MIHPNIYCCPICGEIVLELVPKKYPDDPGIRFIDGLPVCVINGIKRRLHENCLKTYQVIERLSPSTIMNNGNN